VAAELLFAMEDCFHGFSFSVLASRHARYRDPESFVTGRIEALQRLARRWFSMGGKHTPDELGLYRLCTIKEIADKAQVGVATVHRVLKARPVRADSLAAVKMAILELNMIAIRQASTERGEADR
jgi:hypothetical protein